MFFQKNEPKSSDKSDKPDFFGRRGGLTRRGLREKLKKGSARIPGTGGKMFGRRQRVELEKDFGKKYGSNITKQEYQKRIKELSKEKFKSKTSSEKLAIGRKIRYLKKIAE